ncbi:MAG: putative MBL fold metallo-hydrolase [Promethearchaeota archaeon]|nr:MAG: putative MBL fold metallo-hydrolase [Candidatus Lokiarchaeota archaeon]
MGNITVLVDDLDGAVDDFTLSYGFAALIKIGNTNVLFDTGTKEDPLIKNLNLMGYDARDLDAVILSHNHYDHTNGLPLLLKTNPDLPVYVHKDWDKEIRFKGKKIPLKNKKMIEVSRNLDEISPNLFLTDSFYSSDYGGVYEHACYVKTNQNLILLCGCCHPGLNKFLQNREKLGLSNEFPLTIIGGLHGFSFTDQEATNLSPKIKNIVLFHCTSKINTFQNQFKERCSIGKVGKIYEL